MWSQIEPTPSHLVYVFLPLFLISYALLSSYIRNTLHLSEPPLATIWGIIIGPYGLGLVRPRSTGLGDNVMIEITRIVAAVQCFVVGVELPNGYMRTHWKNLAILLGPVMSFGWLVCSGFIVWIFKVDFSTALIVAACLTPTDPVLAASVLGGSSFAESVPKRIRNLLKAESGSNDGIAFPFLYVGISILTRYTLAGTMKKWALVTLLYQCVLGTIIGLVIGRTAGVLMSYSERKRFLGSSSFLMFYLLLAMFAIGVASTLGMDDFLVAFAAGIGLSQRADFWEHVEDSKLPVVVDTLLSSTMFIYFGTDMPWRLINSEDYPFYSAGRLVGFLALVLLFRRIPIVLLLKPFITDIHSWGEAWFVGHFGPMGVGALFLALEARAQLETDSSVPLPDPPSIPNDLDPDRARAVKVIWPIICFVVFGSIMVHGMSTLAISTYNWVMRMKDREEERPLLNGHSSREYGSDRGDDSD